MQNIALEVVSTIVFASIIMFMLIYANRMYIRDMADLLGESTKSEKQKRRYSISLKVIIVIAIVAVISLMTMKIIELESEMAYLYQMFNNIDKVITDLKIEEMNEAVEAYRTVIAK